MVNKSWMYNNVSSDIQKKKVFWNYCVLFFNRCPNTTCTSHGPLRECRVAVNALKLSSDKPILKSRCLNLKVQTLYNVEYKTIFVNVDL